MSDKTVSPNVKTGDDASVMSADELDTVAAGTFHSGVEAGVPVDESTETLKGGVAHQLSAVC